MRYAQPNLTAGLDDVLFSTAQSVPTFPIMILVFIFMVILLAGSTSQKRRTGNADVPMWFALAGFSTTMVALIMTIPPGMINGLTGIVVLGAVIGISILGAVWFFFSKTRGEQ